jgi:uncharacterized protein YjiK
MEIQMLWTPFLFAVLLTGMSGCRTSESVSGTQDATDSGFELEIVDQMRVDGRELSGMAFRGTGSTIELLIISDSSYKVLSVEFDGAFSSKQFYYDSKDAIPTADINSKSQWEAIAADKNHVFILQENPGRVFVFSENMKRLDQIVELKVPKSSPLFPVWENDPNSRGEGLVLLKNGHFLVIKEKNPVQLIEFGPEGEESDGFRPGDAATPEDTLTLQPGKSTVFVPLKHWDIGTNSVDLLKDASELTVGPDGKLYALSDQAERIVAIENVLRKSEQHFKVKQNWKLAGKVTKPEGTIIHRNFAPLVTSDLSAVDQNLFLLKKLF